MSGRADRGFFAGTLRITKNKIQKQICTAEYFSLTAVQLFCA
jgi:hypothetical protein